MEKEMTMEREAAILEGAIKKFGVKAQAAKAIEEMSELCQVLAKYLCYGLADDELCDHIMEEMADAGIMLNQLQLIFGDTTEWEIVKLERLEKMIGGAY